MDISATARTDLQEILDRRRVTVAEAQKIAGVCRRTIYNWLDAGKLDYVRLPSGKIRIFADSIFREGE